jgi:hypothetical protein
MSQNSMRSQLESKIDKLRNDMKTDIDTKIKSLKDDVSLSIGLQASRIDKVVKL